MEPSAKTDQSPSGSLYFLGAVLFISGVMRLVTRSDVPFGILLVSVPIAGILGARLKKYRIAKSAVHLAIVLVILACGITEIASHRMISGIAALAIASIAVLAWQHSAR